MLMILVVMMLIQRLMVAVVVAVGRSHIVINDVTVIGYRLAGHVTVVEHAVR